MGKAYANRKQETDRPEGDFYATPKSLVWVAEDIIRREFSKDIPILEPCSGGGAISDELSKLGYTVATNDLFRGGKCYIAEPFTERYVITNPPFSLWDSFVTKAKSHAEKVMMIGRLNYLGTQSRHMSGIWNNLKAMYCFTRYVDYQTPPREDGMFHVGAMATAWFLWDMNYTGSAELHTLDVQKYAKLGNYNKSQKNS